MGVKVLKQKPSQADAILPCVSLFLSQASGSYCAVQQCSKPVLFLASLFFSLSLSLSREEEEEGEGEGGGRSRRRRRISDVNL